MYSTDLAHQGASQGVKHVLAFRSGSVNVRFCTVVKVLLSIGVMRYCTAVLLM